jgi:predicted transport protein
MQFDKRCLEKMKVQVSDTTMLKVVMQLISQSLKKVICCFESNFVT